MKKIAILILTIILIATLYILTNTQNKKLKIEKEINKLNEQIEEKTKLQEENQKKEKELEKLKEEKKDKIKKYEEVEEWNKEIINYLQ